VLHPGDTIDRFTVEALLGTGGTAVVYRVRHQTLGTTHALKVLSVTSDVIRERMLTEGRVQAAMQHPNIVAVTDVIDVDGAPGLLMEYIEGPTLDKALDKYRISPASAETLFIGIASGVRKAHEHGLVHRDLKPANVLLARTIEGFVPKVADFGLAKVLEEARDGQEGHTRSGVALGTPAYMAPEQIHDARTVDQRADIFALGCILYELMTRRRAFPGDNTISIYNNILDGRIVPARHWVPDLDERIDTAIKGALVIDKGARIPDTDTLLAVLAGEMPFEVPERPEADTGELELIPELGPGSTSRGPDLQVAQSRPGLEPPDISGDPLLRSIHDQTGRGMLPPGPRPPTPPPAVDRDETEPVPRSGWVFLVGATVVFLLALGFAVVGTALALMSSLEPQPQPQAGPALASSDVLGDPEPDPKPAPATEPAPLAATAPAAEPAPVQHAAPAPRRPARITVKILSMPPTASLHIDGRDQGRTPAKLDLAPGRHTVKIQSGAESGTFHIDAREGSENKWCYAFGTSSLVEGSCP